MDSAWRDHALRLSILTGVGIAAAMRNWREIGFAIALCFGLWWLVSPRSVIAFYTRFHRGAVTMPAASGVRIAGALWMALVIIVAFFSAGHEYDTDAA